MKSTLSKISIVIFLVILAILIKKIVPGPLEWTHITLIPFVMFLTKLFTPNKIRTRKQALRGILYTLIIVSVYYLFAYFGTFEKIIFMLMPSLTGAAITLAFVFACFSTKTQTEEE